MADRGWLSVSLPYVTSAASDAWQAEAAAGGGVGSQRLLEVAEVAAPAEVAAAFGVERGTVVVVRRRLMLLDDRPVELTDSYYPLAIARGTALATPQKIRGGAVTLLAELGYRPGRTVEDVYARAPTAEEREALALGGHRWVLGLTRLITTEDGTPVEVSVMIMVADGRRLRYETKIGD
ncbi:UTRA domain-containing protein [Micromonospora sp. WMMD882]|uniref:UTRA domain-containing protein n=1 Tax=Micromonospora sp. WMMD882 TaxID=3015151 RepID=UPI00248BA915|nr:UTRA domain-containing protein [Micromonospora sp. WMMD882]WBB78161.1 UTRA domain-containing protein [Micromonospora sp. WMMD882]